MYNWDKPLPKHTNYRYEECYAKIVLEELYPKEFKNLEIKDKPDLQTSSCGIEVTIAEDEKQLESENLYASLPYIPIHEKEKVKQKIKKNGNEVEEYFMIGKPTTDSFSLIYERLRKKLMNLNKEGYSIFTNNYLFVFSSILAGQQMLIEAKDEMQNIQSKYEKKFDRVYVCVPQYCYFFDFKKNEYFITNISYPVQYQQACQAREFVEKYSK